MKKKIHVKNNEDKEIRFVSWLKMIVDLMKVKILVLILGRGTGKTSDIVAERVMHICDEMPKSYIALVADTYTNILKNIAPALIEGFKRKGWEEGVHFVVDKEPPIHFRKPYKTPITYKHTISTYTGNFFNYISMDMKTSGAGNSYQHIVIDEGKNVEKNKVDLLFPALRGPATDFGFSHFFMGYTITSDYPDVTIGEHDWFLDLEKEMNVDKIKALFQISLELNEAKIDLLNAIDENNLKKAKILQRKVTKLSVKHYILRLDSIFYYVASSFVNVDNLRLGYFKVALQKLGIENFNKSVLSLPPTVEAGQRFYIGFDPDKHIYDDGIDGKFYNQFNTGDKADANSTALKYCDPDQPIEIGLDFGDMCSMVIGQTRGTTLFILKNMWTLPPENEQQLTARFLEFFRFHRNKKIELYFDRSGNAYHTIGKDWANSFKNYFEAESEFGTWTVELKSRGQGIIPQQTEYQLAKEMMFENRKELPNIRFDKYQCKQLISSINVSKQIVKIKTDGTKRIYKNKTSEKLPKHRLPMSSTNLSDAMKYLICRRDWLAVFKENETTWSDPDFND